MLVVDASAVVELLLGRPVAGRIAELFAAHDHDLHAPHLLDVEVLSALRRVVAGGEASAARAGEAVADLLSLSLTRYPHDVLAPRIWDLRDNFSAYDASYLALADAVTDGGAPLLTADGRLARAGRSHGDVQIILVA